MNPENQPDPVPISPSELDSMLNEEKELEEEAEQLFIDAEMFSAMPDSSPEVAADYKPPKGYRWSSNFGDDDSFIQIYPFSKDGLDLKRNFIYVETGSAIGAFWLQAEAMLWPAGDPNSAGFIQAEEIRRALLGIKPPRAGAQQPDSIKDLLETLKVELDAIRGLAGLKSPHSGVDAENRGNTYKWPRDFDRRVFSHVQLYPVFERLTPAAIAFRKALHAPVIDEAEINNRAIRELDMLLGVVEECISLM